MAVTTERPHRVFTSPHQHLNLRPELLRILPVGLGRSTSSETRRAERNALTRMSRICFFRYFLQNHTSLCTLPSESACPVRLFGVTKPISSFLLPRGTVEPTSRRASSASSGSGSWGCGAETEGDRCRRQPVHPQVVRDDLKHHRRARARAAVDDHLRPAHRAGNGWRGRGTDADRAGSVSGS